MPKFLVSFAIKEKEKMEEKSPEQKHEPEGE